MQIIKTIDAHIAKTWVDTSEAVIIDVREPGEYEELHIEGAKLIPLGSLCMIYFLNFTEEINYSLLARQAWKCSVRKIIAE